MLTEAAKEEQLRHPEQLSRGRSQGALTKKRATLQRNSHCQFLNARLKVAVRNESLGYVPMRQQARPRVATSRTNSAGLLHWHFAAPRPSDWPRFPVMAGGVKGRRTACGQNERERAGLRLAGIAGSAGVWGVSVARVALRTGVGRRRKVGAHTLVCPPLPWSHSSSS